MKKFSVIAALMALAMIITACGGTASSAGFRLCRRSRSSQW